MCLILPVQHYFYLYLLLNYSDSSKKDYCILLMLDKLKK